MTTISLFELEKKEKLLALEIAQKQELLDALQRTRQYLETGGSSDNHDASVLEEPAKSHKSSAPLYGRNTQLVRNAIKQIKRNYTIRDIRSYLDGSGESLSSQSITTVLNRLKKSGEIKEVRKGKGRRPARFKR